MLLICFEIFENLLFLVHKVSYGFYIARYKEVIDTIVHYNPLENLSLFLFGYVYLKRLIQAQLFSY